jgi:omega-amidase
MVCYDVRFPEVARALMLAEADIIYMPSAFPLARIFHLNALIKARAIENQIFLVAANRVGIDGPGLTFGGRSQIVDPDGTILASASEVEETMLIAEINAAL